ncbi:SIMPL domain-containing protein [Lachnoanaerobaculum gingivalis]|nr:SIMPL domain-containing protein [Lachnoanaerobaculum gingivalis]RKW56336.1 MAG: DUF541 domain-containing protein [Lachnospiraceae bacterium]
MSSRTIRVTGNGNLKVKPDMTRVTIELTGVKYEYSEALKVSAEDTIALKSLLKKEHFEAEDIKTIDFNVDIERESYKDNDDEWKTRFLGYRYRHTLKVEFPNDKKRLGDILNLLADCTSLQPEFRFTFFLNEPEKSKNILLANAVTDAREKAEILSKAAGVELLDIISIDYSWLDINFEVIPMRSNPNFLHKSELKDKARYNVDIEPEDIKVSDNVTIVWGIK